jgi:hypothetical protein
LFLGIRKITNMTGAAEPAAKRAKKGVITLVTGNANKLKEIQTILGDEFPYDV